MSWLFVLKFRTYPTFQSAHDYCCCWLLACVKLVQYLVVLF